jgi:hypothetical protein
MDLEQFEGIDRENLARESKWLFESLLALSFGEGLAEVIDSGR